ncbi:hypothetical protein V2J09_017690 [Rumex salicifolius]
MPPTLRSRQVTPSKSTPTKSGSKSPTVAAAAALDSPQELPGDRGRSVRLASSSSSSSKGKMISEEEEELQSLHPPTGYVSHSDVDDDPTVRKKLKFGIGSPDHDDKGKGKVIDSDQGVVSQDPTLLATRFSREDKGKGIMMDASVDLELKLGVGVPDSNPEEEKLPPALNPESQASANAAPPSVPLNPNNLMLEQRLRISKDIAKQNASKFARAGSIDRVEDEADSDPDDREAEATEDWPGPFSTAMKIIQDRQSKGSGQAQHFRLDNAGAPTVIWKPNLARKQDSSLQKKRIAPSLQDLSMQVLVNNSDAITSLEFVPDALRHKLVSMLCDTRKMTVEVLHLIFQGSPSEICITDCSWIEEEQFKKSFEACNTQNLMILFKKAGSRAKHVPLLVSYMSQLLGAEKENKEGNMMSSQTKLGIGIGTHLTLGLGLTSLDILWVLQLDLCGRCMPDYVVQETLANKGLPALTTLSLKGACRLSDEGLKTLISSAPALKSLNLSQCSLITNAGINAVADSLRSGLRELYLDDCQSLNVMLLMPELERLANLEVLSLAGIPSVSDKFLKQLIGSIGRNIKELALANCGKLTDSTLRVISKNCYQLCALDLAYVTKLTDSGIGYLASCCQAIQSLKLCRNTFSDEAFAAFLEACGESLKELSLNNVSQVGPHTSISIARRCKNLVELDVSWCRNLTDECLGVIADSCESLRMLKVFGCTQITSTFWFGHSNQELRVIGISSTPILENPKKQDQLRAPLRYSAALGQSAAGFGQPCELVLGRPVHRCILHIYGASLGAVHHSHIETDLSTLLFYSRGCVLLSSSLRQPSRFQQL